MFSAPAIRSNFREERIPAEKLAVSGEAVNGGSGGACCEDVDEMALDGDRFLQTFQSVLDHLAREKSASLKCGGSEKAEKDWKKLTGVLAQQKNLSSLLMLHRLMSEHRLKDAKPVDTCAAALSLHICTLLRASPSKKPTASVTRTGCARSCRCFSVVCTCRVC